MVLPRPILARLILAAGALAATAVCAHETAGKHGGRVRDAGAYHVELVARGRSVEVYLLDSGERPVPASGFKGSAVLIADGKPARIALSPTDGNRLSGTAGTDLPASPRGAVLLTAPDGATASGKFD